VTTRDRLLAAAARALAEDGVAGASARSIAARAGVNQALVFYHFTTVAELLEAAVRASVDEAAADYRQRFDEVTSVSGLLELAEALHAAEKERGNVAQMAQVMAGAQRDAALARAARHALDRWSGEVEAVLRRVLAGSPLEEYVDTAGLAATVTAGFVGLQLVEAVDADRAADAIGSLRVLAALVEAVDGLGPVATRVLGTRLRKALPTSG
jgi:AcrR family transcriptional regulator